MDHFEYRSGTLHAEGVALARVAGEHGTPCFVYSRATLERHWRAFDDALAPHPHLICYSVKANSNLAVLRTLARLGSGFDIVSEGELARVVAAGGDPGRTVFSGVGKGEQEMAAALAAGVRCFNVESEPELDLLARVAAGAGRRAPVALRVNPDVDPRTHPYIATGLREAKFGIPHREAPAVFARAAAETALDVVGIDCHIGSQLTALEPFGDALDRVLGLVDDLAAGGIRLRHVNLGGGLGVRYQDETPPEPSDYAATIAARMRGRGLELMVEPGRAIAGNAGVLLTRVRYLKRNGDRRFAVVDAAMNDLLRPALYGAWQAILPVAPRDDVDAVEVDVVGPVCETADFLGKDRRLALAEGDLLAVRTAGAYGFVMSSNYNSRPRAAEVMVDGDAAFVVRERERVEDLFALERVLPERG